MKRVIKIACAICLVFAAVSCSNLSLKNRNGASIAFRFADGNQERSVSAVSQKEVTAYKVSLYFINDGSLEEVSTQYGVSGDLIVYNNLEPGKYAFEVLAYKEETVVRGGDGSVELEQDEVAEVMVEMNAVIAIYSNDGMNCGLEDDELTYDPTHTESGYRLKEPAFSADAIPSGKVLDYWLMEGSTTHYQPGDEILFASFDKELPFKFTAVWKNGSGGSSGTTGGGGSGGLAFTPVSLNITMKEITGANVTTNSSQSGGPFASAGTAPVAVSSFMIAETELTYEKWYEVYQWAISTDRNLETGHGKYTFSSKGKGGSTGTDGEAPEDETRNKPVTSIDFRDAVIWCNAASEREGLQPVYFIGGTEGQQFGDSTRILRNSDSVDESAAIMPLANGYRLPTAAEWEYAARGGDPSDSTNWGYTFAGSDAPGICAVYNVDEASDVGSKSANGAGLKDMSGNVAEYVWAFSSSSCFIYGGNYADSNTNSLMVYNYTTTAINGGSEYSGFRVARNEQRSPTGFGVTMKPITGGSVTVAIGSGTSPFMNASAENPVTVSDFNIAETELTYKQWYDVYTWALQHGYVFANLGNRGVATTAGGQPPEGNVEPVTNITLRDALVWCNAASEYAGLSPVYYLEGTPESHFGDVTKVLRTAEGESVSDGLGKAEKAVFDPNADGYRLPSDSEWEYAARGGNPAGDTWTCKYAGSDDINSVAVYGKTGTVSSIPVHTKNANAAGLYDMTGNVFEMCWNVQGDANVPLRSCAYSTVSQIINQHMRSVKGVTYKNQTIGFRIAQNAQ